MTNWEQWTANDGITAARVRRHRRIVHSIVHRKEPPCPRSPSSARAAPSSPRTCWATSSASRAGRTPPSACTTSTRSACAPRRSSPSASRTALGAHPRIEATLDRRAALDGADYAIAMFQIAGYKPGTVIDFEIPKKYGLRQTIADTLGIGGIMRGLRTIPVLLDMCRDMEELCPDATFLNYVNPMAMNTWAINRASKIKTVGLCHSVQGTAEQLAADIGVPDRGDQLRRRRASTTWRSTSSSSARPPAASKTSTRACARWSPRAACPTGTGCATRCWPAWATSSPSPASTSASTCPGSSSATGPT